MKTYKIPVSWEVYGYLEIQADSLDEAIKIAENDDTNLPVESCYIEGSFWVDRDGIDLDEYEYQPTDHYTISHDH